MPHRLGFAQQLVGHLLRVIRLLDVVVEMVLYHVERFVESVEQQVLSTIVANRGGDQMPMGIAFADHLGRMTVPFVDGPGLDGGQTR